LRFAGRLILKESPCVKGVEKGKVEIEGFLILM